MAKFNITRTEKGLPGTSGSVRDSNDPAIGAGVIGQAAAGLGTEVKDLGIRFDLIQAKSQLSDSMVHAANLTNSFFDTLGSNEDPETYGEELAKLNKQIESVTPENSRAAGVFRQNMATRSIQTAKLVRIAAEKKIERKSQTSDFLLLQTAKASGLEADFDVYEKAVINGVKLGVYDAKEGELLLDNADKDRDTAEKNEVFTRASSQRDEEGIMDVDRALAHVDAWDGPENDKADIRNQIQNKAAQEQKRSDEALANRTGEEDARLNDLLIENQLSDQEIELVDLGARGKQKTFEKNFKANWKTDLRKINALSEPLLSNENVYDDLVVGNGSVERGSMSPTEWETNFRNAWANGDLSRADRRALRSGDIVATKSMQNRAFLAQTDGSSQARSSLVEATEGQIQQFTTQRDLLNKSKDFTGAEAFTFALQKGQIQRWNFGRFRDELRTQMGQNEDWSQEQIFIASDILENQYDKDFDVLVAEFDAANPSKAITNTPPGEGFKDIWKGLSVEDKAKIWELRMFGESVESIIGEL
jgi:hypothetical protein